ncbi:hypothetical protein ATY41_01120 [Leifsonia xyli subsp. xyli]|nr:hypothetical protein [Leifsonia xyli]ODA91316.1 hypothetical protein ATY41_01120 [Leifsonia xyli subsp. xyli]
MNGVELATGVSAFVPSVQYGGPRRVYWAVGAAVSENSIGALKTDQNRLYAVPTTVASPRFVDEDVVAFATMVEYDGSRILFYSKKDATLWRCDTDTMKTTQIRNNAGLVTTIRAASNGSSVVAFRSETGRLFNSAGAVVAENVPAFDTDVDASSNRKVFYAQYSELC